MRASLILRAALPLVLSSSAATAAPWAPPLFQPETAAANAAMGAGLVAALAFVAAATAVGVTFLATWMAESGASWPGMRAPAMPPVRRRVIPAETRGRNSAPLR